MSEEELEREVKRLLANPTLKFPLPCSRILGYLIASGSPLRLSDQSRLESVLFKIADSSQATFSVYTDVNGVFVTRIHNAHCSPPLKRKRIDSEVDSTSSLKDDTKSCHGLSAVPIPSADKAIQDIFSLLQKGTTRSKLIAEQVSHFVGVYFIRLWLIVSQHGSTNERFEPICEHITKETCSKVRLNSGVSHSTAICEKVRREN
jgi:mRNA m6A methyltransferase catalytic subunit